MRGSGTPVSLRSDRLLREDLGEPDRLAAEIGLGTAEHVALEEPQRHDRRDQPAHDDAEQEERRQPEPQRAEHQDLQGYC